MIKLLKIQLKYFENQLKYINSVNKIKYIIIYN